MNEELEVGTKEQKMMRFPELKNLHLRLGPYDELLSSSTRREDVKAMMDFVVQRRRRCDSPDGTQPQLLGSFKLKVHGTVSDVTSHQLLKEELESRWDEVVEPDKFVLKEECVSRWDRPAWEDVAVDPELNV